MFCYTQPDGSVRRELRPPEEVFRQDSLDTLRDAPVISRHGDMSMLRPDNWKEFAIGHVSGSARADGKFVAADLAILESDGLARVDSGDLSEISCGYNCRDDKTPGVWNGERYDLIQRDIKYNHVGLGPKNWGRAGNEVGLRLDSCSVCVFDSEGDSPLIVGTTPKVEKMLIRFDGKEYEVGSAEHCLAMTNRLDAQASDLAAKTKSVEVLQSKLDSALEDLSKAKADLASASDPAKLDALVSDRVNLVVDAAKVLGPKYKFDGLSAEKIMTDAITAVKPEKKLDGKSVDYIRATFDTLVESGARADGIEAVPGVLRRLDSSKVDADKARQDAADLQKRLDAQNEPVWDAVKGDK